MTNKIQTWEDFDTYKREEAQSALTAMLGALGVLMAVTLILCGCPKPGHTEEIIDVDQYVQAIYHTEGGDRAQYPYGIRSVPCGTKSECERIARNTVRNNIKRYNEYGKNQFASYLEFLASRFAPIGASNDPSGFNKNWIKNMRFFLKKLKKNES